VTPPELPAALHGLLAAECAAEAHGRAVDAEDLHQAVWLMWLERARSGRPPHAPAAWLRAAVRAQARAARRRGRRETPLPPAGLAHGTAAAPVPVVADDGHADAASATEAPLLAAERRRVFAAAAARLPGRCPQLIGALLRQDDPTYEQIARSSGISQGSLGPLRSRCLGCLRRMLSPEVAAPRVRGRVR
jgi:RNA polymerase sigma factor (sigma-70 family)